ncbi:hypothetical protein ABW21_db0204327 [Orbilia brochopaga]|nr:hypothetical protein ABW21_db0204327 [Drechslerella brochopaga]
MRRNFSLFYNRRPFLAYAAPYMTLFPPDQLFFVRKNFLGRPNKPQANSNRRPLKRGRTQSANQTRRPALAGRKTLLSECENLWGLIDERAALSPGRERWLMGRRLFREEASCTTAPRRQIDPANTHAAAGATLRSVCRQPIAACEQPASAVVDACGDKLRLHPLISRNQLAESPLLSVRVYKCMSSDVQIKTAGYAPPHEQARVSTSFCCRTQVCPVHFE